MNQDIINYIASKFYFGKAPEEALNFDDVSLVTGLSKYLPTEVDITAKLTETITLKIPIMSAAMDTVTEWQIAAKLAELGSVGTIHKNMSIDEQVRQVEKVKRGHSGIITKPYTLPPSATIGYAKRIMEENNISGIPILSYGKVKGLLTRRDIYGKRLSDEVSRHMTHHKDLIYVEYNQNYKIDDYYEKAKKLISKHRIEKVLIIKQGRELYGIVTKKDIDNPLPNASLDEKGRLRVTAAIGPFDYERVEALVAAGVDALVIDTAHGGHINVRKSVKIFRNSFENIIKGSRQLKLKFKNDLQLIAGNISNYEQAVELIPYCDAIKIGQGPGATCTTRRVSGAGIPQLTAIMLGRKAVIDSRKQCRVIGDGGIKYSGDITKAIGAGADLVMIGTLLAGTEESPGKKITENDGRTHKIVRGMGSLGAMQEGSKERYGQKKIKDPKKLVPEGEEFKVPYKGSVGDVIYQHVGGLRSGMGYVGVGTIEELIKKDGIFVKKTSSGSNEGYNG